MAAHRTPSTPRQRRTTAVTAFATALAVVGLMFVGSALSTSPPGRETGTLGPTTGPITLLDAPAAPETTTPAVRKSDAPRATTTKSRATTITKRTTTTTADSEE